MITEIDEQNPVCIFKWHFVTRAQLTQLGLLEPGKLLPLLSPFMKTNWMSKESTASPKDELSHSLPPPSQLALDFLRRSNELLISLLTLDQKKRFCEKLMGLKEFEADDGLQVEEPEGRRELSRFMQRLAGMKEGEETGNAEGDMGEERIEQGGDARGGVKEEEGGKGKGKENQNGEMDGSGTGVEGGQSGSGVGTLGVTIRRRSLRNKA